MPYLFPASDRISVFCESMEVKAEQLGLSNTTLFRDPCGIANESSAADMLRCLIRANENATLREIFGTAHYTIAVGGKNPRELALDSTVLTDPDSHLLTDHYTVIGGKTGTLTPHKAFNLSVVVRIPDSDDCIACTVMYADDPNGGVHNRFQAAREAIDAAVAKYRNRDIDALAASVCAQSAVACVVPPLAADEYHPQLDILFAKNVGKQRKPASMTQLVTAVIALEYLADLDEVVTVQRDVLDCIPSEYYAGDLQDGDTLTVRDLLYAMMLPSGNAAAYILAAHVGEAIFNAY